MIRETIITTRHADGTTHIAPMGIHIDGESPVLMPFKPSQTLENLLRERHAVINFTDDVRIFAGCLGGKRDWPLLPASRIDGNRLANTLAHAEVRVATVQDDPVRPRLVCEIIHEETHAPFRGFNRAQASIVELAILVSRLHLLPWEKIEREMAYLRIAVDKTAGEEETVAWDWLAVRVRDFRREQGIE